MTSWFKGRLGRIRVSTAVLIVAFIALFWVQQTFQPEPAPEAPAPAVVPPGFVPDPNYTWVPRTYVRRPKEADNDHDAHDDHERRRRRHHEPDVADVADPDDDGGRSGRSGWPAWAADPDADTGLGNADHGVRRYRGRCPPRRRRRDSPTGAGRLPPLHWRAVLTSSPD